MVLRRLNLLTEHELLQNWSLPVEYNFQSCNNYANCNNVADIQLMHSSDEFAKRSYGKTY